MDPAYSLGALFCLVKLQDRAGWFLFCLLVLVWEELKGKKKKKDDGEVEMAGKLSGRSQVQSRGFDVWRKKKKKNDSWITHTRMWRVFFLRCRCSVQLQPCHACQGFESLPPSGEEPPKHMENITGGGGTWWVGEAKKTECWRQLSSAYEFKPSLWSVFEPFSFKKKNQKEQ